MTSERPHLTNDELVRLVTAARAGSEDAWNQLVAGLSGVVWKAANMMSPDRDIRNDVFATTWLRLAERLDTIREPAKLPGWLATTATNEARAALRRRARFDPGLDDLPPARQPVGDRGDYGRRMVESENRRIVREAFARMDNDSRELLTVLIVTDPPPTYEEAAELLGRPVGSLGPLRRRALDKLRKLIDEGTGL